MADVLGYYMEQIEAKIAEMDAKIAEKDTSFVTYLVKENKSNEDIKKIVHGVNDDFINKVRESIY